MKEFTLALIGNLLLVLGSISVAIAMLNNSLLILTCSVIVVVIGCVIGLKSDINENDKPSREGDTICRP